MQDRVSVRLDCQLVTLHMNNGCSVRGIGHGRNETAVPVEIIGGNLFCGIGKILRSSGNTCIKRHQYVECIGGKGQPLDYSRILRLIRAHLDHSNKVISINANRTVFAALRKISAMGIRIVWCALIMGGKHVFDILYGQLFLRHQTPWNIIGLRPILCVCAIPGEGMRI